MVQKLCKQGFHYNIKELFEPITKAITEGNQKVLERTKPNTKEILQLDESNGHLKTLELLNKNGVSYSILIRHIAKFLVTENINLDYTMILILIIGMNI